MSQSSILDHIGNTPLLRLDSMSPNPAVKIWGKLELANPSGSLKDRIALYMIEHAEERGELRKGMTIIEATSGNTGIALGMVAAVKGYPLKLFMLENKTIERRKLLGFWGAEVVLTTKDDPDSHIFGAQALIESNPDDYFYINQNENEDNPGAHYEGIGKELVSQLDGRIDGFIAGFGTGGTLVGVARYFRDHGVSARMCAVEPFDCPRAKIDGLKHSSESYQPRIYDRSLIDETVEVPEDEAYRTARAVARQEGLIVGLSSGATVWAAQQLARKMDHGNLVVILGDRAERYFSTSLFG